MTELNFAAPAFLGLLALLVWFVWTSRRSLSGWNWARRSAAIGLRLTVVALIVMALSDAETKQAHEKVCVIYLLDQSDSIPLSQRSAMFEYVSRDVERFRDERLGDLAGVIVFGREAAVEVPPVEALGWLGKRETVVQRISEATDVAAAFKMALTIFPPNTARRVVLISDGNENRGASLEIATEYRNQGVGIDVVAIPVEQTTGVFVERMVVPHRVKQDSMIDTRVILENSLPETSDDSTPREISGQLKITRSIGGNSEVMISQDISLPPGKTVFSLPHRTDQGSGFYSYEATFVPHDPTIAARTPLAQRRAEGFTNVEGQGRVLLLENPEAPGGFETLVRGLRNAGIMVDVRNEGELIGSFAELQNYDTVVLADLPRVTGIENGQIISDQQIELLVRNTEMGCGLVILGGPNSFGAGGWANSKLEEASPVNFTVKNSKVLPQGSLVIVLDKSGSMDGDKINSARQAALAAIQTLSDNDYVGVVGFDAVAQWSVPFQQIAGRRDAMRSLVRRIGADGGTDVYAGMKMGFEGLRKAKTGIKHMIVLSDGQTPPAEFDALVRQMRTDGITVSTVAVGDDADRNLMTRIARIGAGRFYNVTDSRLIPRIFMKETMRVTRPLIYERDESFVPNIVGYHDSLIGLENPLPPIRGFVLTERKENPLVHVAIESPLPPEDGVNTIMASWNFGIGRSVVFTTDAGQRWATQWPEWSQYTRFYEQMIRWSMRPSGQDGIFNASAQVRDGKLVSTLTATDNAGQPLNSLNVVAFVVTPSQEIKTLTIHQVAPGRYVGELATDEPGNYFLSIRPSLDHQVITIGTQMQAAQEARESSTNWNLLTRLSEQKPEGGQAGHLKSDGVLDNVPAAFEAHAFRKTLLKPFDFRDIRPLLVVLAASALFFDVLVRRVSFDTKSWSKKFRSLFAKPDRSASEAATISRLKAKVDQVRSETPTWNFQSDGKEEVLTTTQPEKPLREARTPSPDVSMETERSEQKLSYTERLLAAKKRTGKE